MSPVNRKQGWIQNFPRMGLESGEGVSTTLVYVYVRGGAREVGAAYPIFCKFSKTQWHREFIFRGVGGRGVPEVPSIL